MNTFGHLNIGLDNDQHFISTIKKRYQELEDYYASPERVALIEKSQKDQNEAIKSQSYIDHIFEYFKKNPLKYKGND